MRTTANPPSPHVGTASRRPGPRCPTSAFLLGIGVLGLISSEAAAAPLTIRYGGTINSAGPGADVKPGDRFSGLITYDPDGTVSTSYIGGHVEYPRDGRTAISSDTNNTTFSFVDTYGRPSGPGGQALMTLEVGGKPIYSIADSLTINVSRYQVTWQDGSLHSYTSWSFRPTNDDSKLDGLLASVQFSNSAFTAPNSLDKLPTQFALSDYPGAYFDVYDARNPPIPIPTAGPAPLTADLNRGYSGVIDTFEVVSTPEPSTTTLLGLGVAGWLIHSRRRRARPAA